MNTIISAYLIYLSLKNEKDFNGETLSSKVGTVMLKYVPLVIGVVMLYNRYNGLFYKGIDKTSSIVAVCTNFIDKIL